MGRQRQLAELLQDGTTAVFADGATAVRGVAYDSRRVQPGDVFVAIPGYRVDGTAYVGDALQRGAVAIVAERDRIDDVASVPWVRVPSARRALASLSCAWFEHPSHELDVVGVTGTNGKTTVTALLERLLATRGASGRWSTTLVRWAGHSFPTPRPTPEALELQQALRGMVEAGCWAVAIEVSSHALALHRVDGTRFAAAVFTNLSPDHLDFHGDMDGYLDAKAMLFERLGADAPALINAGDARGRQLARRCGGKPLLYGWQDRADDLDYAATLRAASAAGSELSLQVPDGTSVSLRTPLFGTAMCENVVAAVATALELGVDSHAAAGVVEQFGGEPGRLQAVDVGQDFRVLVDFAHTPAALQAAIEAARSITDARLIVVFGCGGDRDRGKRPQMGAIAAALADRIFVTSDNPRSEAPGSIIDQIVAGVPPGSRAALQIEPDRQRAIDAAIDAARTDDCVLIAGKGHETSQTFADRSVAFDDRDVATVALHRRLGSQVHR